MIFSEPPVDLVAETLDIPVNEFVLLSNMYQDNTINGRQCRAMYFYAHTYNRSYRLLCKSIYNWQKLGTSQTKKQNQSNNITSILLILEKQVSSYLIPLALKLEEPEDVANINGFTEMTEEVLQHMISDYGLL